jgi:acyl-CoA synthetase (AMP-forming)/AMP-acid ligase II/thioesterase domain-containing protein
MADTIQSLLCAAAHSSPESPAVLGVGRRPLVFRQLVLQVARTVRVLNELGIGRPDRVAIVLPNGPEVAVCCLSVASAATCAPLNPAYSAAEFEFYLSDLKPRIIIVDSQSDSAAMGVADSMGIPVVQLVTSQDEPAGIFTVQGAPVKPSTDSGSAEPSDIALLLHTSGSTSRPKLVPLSQANMCASAASIRASLQLTTEDCCLNIMPLFHIHGLIGAVLSSLAAGASVVCTPRFEAARFFDWLDEFQPTWYTAVPTMHRAILARAVQDRAGRSRLRFIRSCSAALPPKLMGELENAFCVPVIEAYGMTEACHQITINPLPPGIRKPGSVGQPTGCEVATLDETGAVTPPGQIGAVAIRGANVTLGYENDPEANASSFTSGWFRTGDLGVFDPDGYLFLTGRTKEIINRGGEKISPREVDEVLMDHPAVAQAITFAVPDERLGEDIGAAVVLHEGAAVTTLELQAFVAERLADFKVPRQVVVLRELPEGRTGKLRRIGLAATLGLTATTRPKDTVARTAPKTETEVGLAGLFCEVLEIGSIGVDDDFFDLGGDSMLATELAARIHTWKKCDFPPVLVFQLTSVAAIAAYLDCAPKSPDASGDFGSSLVPFESTASGPPLFLVPRLSALSFRTLSKHLGPGQRVFGLEPPGIHNGDQPMASVEKLAEHYIQQIRKVQPSGPYLLGGYSFGGFPAYEMACQLERQGEHVALLWLIDSDARSLPQYLASLPKRRVRADRLRHWSHVLRFHSAAVRKLPASERLRYMLQIVNRKHRTLQDMRTHGDTENLPPAVRAVELSNRKARSSYLPKSYSGDVTLVRSTEGVKGFDRTNGWGDLAASVDVCEVRGSAHLNILADPHAEAAAEILRLAIERALRHTVTQVSTTDSELTKVC